MRTAFIDTLTELAGKDKNIYLLTGDLGFSVLGNFAKEFPKRFINCGVAEQNMMGVAAGLALSGKKPYVYSIIPFVTMRCFEQIRNDICYQNLDVKLIGIGSGLAYGYLGATHHAIEDIGILRTLPNMTILSPADPLEAKVLAMESYRTKAPTYIRLNKTGEKRLYKFNPQIKIGRPSILKKGKDVAIVATGISVAMAVEIVEELERMGYNFTLIGMPAIKPIDKKAFLTEILGNKFVFTIEEHNIIGGLGSAAAEILLEAGYKGLFKRFGIPDQYCKETGDTRYLCQKFNLDKKSIINNILKVYEKPQQKRKN